MYTYLYARLFLLKYMHTCMQSVKMVQKNDNYKNETIAR